MSPKLQDFPSFNDVYGPSRERIALFNTLLISKNTVVIEVISEDDFINFV